MRAAVANDVDTLRVALAIGCSPRNIVGPDGSSALVIAAERGNEAAVRMLIPAPLRRSITSTSSAIPR